MNLGSMVGDFSNIEWQVREREKEREETRGE